MKYNKNSLLSNFLIIYEVMSNKVCIRLKPKNITLKYPPSNQMLKIYEAAIVQRWGMNFEEYSTTTDDGYILGIFRVYKTITKANPVVLGHGIFQNALAFLLIGNKSLAYVLGAEGFDVWLINFRGTRYSNNHLNLTVRDQAFWQTGFEQMGMYDMKAVMELVYEKTFKMSIYIGYSMGTITSSIFNIVEEVLAQKTIQNVISLAPAVYTQHAYGFNAALLVWPVFKPICLTLWHGEVLPRAVSIPVVEETCLPLPFQMEICELATTTITGSEVHQMDPDAENLYDKLPQSTKCGFYMVQYSQFSHLDFYKAKDIVPLLYNRLLETISSFQENKC